MGNSEQRRPVGGLGCQSITAARGGRAGSVALGRLSQIDIYSPAARGVWPVPRRHVPAPQDVTGAGTRGGRGHVGWLALPVRACSAAGRERGGSGAQAAGPAPPRGPRRKDGARSLARGGPAVSERRRRRRAACVGGGFFGGVGRQEEEPEEEGEDQDHQPADRARQFWFRAGQARIGALRVCACVLRRVRLVRLRTQTSDTSPAVCRARSRSSAWTWRIRIWPLPAFPSSSFSIYHDQREINFYSIPQYW
jgi:hypothetical protein